MKSSFPPNRVAMKDAEREHALHMKRLLSVKASTDVAPPKSLMFPHMKVNAKKKLMLEGTHARAPSLIASISFKNVVCL